MFKWLHHLFTPHCPDCREEQECKTCDTLSSLLENERAEKLKLLEMLTAKPVEDRTEVDLSQFEVKKFVPWRVRQQQLEKQAKAKAPQTVEELEEELGVTDAK